MLSDSWRVEIRTKYRLKGFCYGVLISHSLVLTSRECKWLLDKHFGSRPLIKFPNIGGQKNIEAKRHIQQSTTHADGYDLIVFELEKSIPTMANFTPICLPQALETKDLMMSSEASINFPMEETTNEDDEAGCQNEALLCQDSRLCDSEENRIPGR